MANNRKENPTLAAHVAEASGAEREIESTLAAHLLLVTRAKHHGRLERHLEGSKARVERLDRRLKDLGGSARSVPKPSKPAKEVKGAAKSAEQRATKIASGSASKVRDAAELRRVLEAAREEQEQALKQTAAYNSLRALAKASDDKETNKLAKRLREEHKDWAKFLTDELKSLSKKLVRAESEEREQAASRRRSATAKQAASSRSSNGRKSSSSRKSSGARKTTSSARGSSRSGSAKATFERPRGRAPARPSRAPAPRGRAPARPSRARPQPGRDPARRSRALAPLGRDRARPSRARAGPGSRAPRPPAAPPRAAPPRAASRPAGYQPGVATAPEHPTDLSGRRWWLTVKRAFSEFQEDNLTDWAAALTYYGLLALFPALIALVSIVGLVMDPETLTDALTDLISELGPASAVDTFKGPIDTIANSDRTGIVLLVVGVIGALFSASAYVGAFARASNEIYETREGRPVYKLRPVQMLITLGMVLLLAVVLLALVISGPIAGAVGEAIGVGDTGLTVWNYAKWPGLLLVVLMMIAVLYYTAPNAKLPKFQWVSPGSLVAVVAWVLASALFALYVSNFDSYNKTYGTLGGMVTLLIWMWITNIAVLFGAELNSELERSRELAAGTPGAERELQLPPRQPPDESSPPAA